MSGLSDHLEDMADSLDEVVTHEDIHRELLVALHLSKAQDRKLEALKSLAKHYHIRASYYPEPEPQWRDIETDLNNVLNL